MDIGVLNPYNDKTYTFTMLSTYVDLYNMTTHISIADDSQKSIFLLFHRMELLSKDCHFLPTLDLKPVPKCLKLIIMILKI